MYFSEFTKSLTGSEPPQELSVYLKALWYDAKNDWETSHRLIQDIDDKYAAWIHAYLHRKEGDIANADYWYKRAGMARPSDSLLNEWEQITCEFLIAKK